MENAFTYMPLLNRLPHLLVLNHPVMTFMYLHKLRIPGTEPDLKYNTSRLIDHPNAKHFVMVALNDRFPGLDTSHVISAPYFFHVHWGQGSPAMRNATHIDPDNVLRTKTQFASESFGLRNYEDRLQIYR